ncbi:putative eka-like protein [Golovinomyces cichoracearum]|uniref:Putative eka-like protein n=1 Tax=Golovinomyces cichoracearum TaxID=62708 RepID=A0A420HNW3_9PEZI|nr:putative eka-like protein [Golovinomyces cichoracearum]
MAPSTSTPDSNKEFNEGLLTYLRAAIAQFLANGTGISPPVLPPKPKSNHQTVSHQQNKLSTIDSYTPEKKIIVKNSWATIARKGHQAKETVKYTKSFESDERLFLRLPKDQEWRLLAPCSIREAVSSHLKYSPTDIIHIRRTATGFALTAKDKDTRFRLLDGSVAHSVQNVKLEPASDLVTYHIATVPVAIASVNKKVLVTNSMLEAEIKRVTHSSPTSVRPLGKVKLGAPYQSWLAHFPRSQAPRPGFRLFDESGVAIIHKPHQPLQQCKRCLDFHPTRGCSRAPACGNCSSTMHDISECKALTRCRNCGGPHRSDNRICLARPTRSGPINKEQSSKID